jgi:hypothetical protein
MRSGWKSLPNRALHSVSIEIAEFTDARGQVCENGVYVEGKEIRSRNPRTCAKTDQLSNLAAEIVGLNIVLTVDFPGLRAAKGRGAAFGFLDCWKPGMSNYWRTDLPIKGLCRILTA